MKVIKLLLIWGITPIFLSGCWNRVEINDIAIVTAIGLDLVEEDKIRLTLQVAVPSKLVTGGTGGTGGKSTLMISETGATVSEAYRNIQGKLPRKIFFSQSRILLVGEDLAKKGVFHIVDFHTRYSEPRINSFIMFTKGEASKIISSMPHFENISAEETRELAKMGVGIKVYVRDFMNMLLTEGLEPFASQFTLEPLEVYTKNKSGKTQALNGIAVFKGDKLAGWMEEDETRGLLWLRNEMKEGVISIKIPHDQDGGNISMEIVRAETKIVPILKGGKIKLDVNVVTELNVIENDSKLNLFETKAIEEIQKYAEEKIRKKVELVIDKAQKEFGSDILGFGQAIYKKYPKGWNTDYKENWEKEFPQTKVTIHSKALIRRIGLVK
ncbi:Ger(x)C family spore germination protein [Neobacillus niacini]|uniref:Ger(x)C family spore germination protein n=1 Tax=Neobacillus niacini TaxID=86668 RepID=UPI0007AB5C47|nr:Ger(x)C family spore germination protein [Neobacillus niacini]MEC1520635.1 Ger(x)C family spore germination protein [Neobacillus niacini]